MSTLSATTIRTRQITHTNGTQGLVLGDSSLFPGTSVVTNTSQPFVYATRSVVANWENFGTTPVAYNYNLVDTNRGNYYNGTTGIFTCPLAGVYLICPSALIGNSANYSTLYIFKNGVNVAYNGIHTNTAGVVNQWKCHSQTFAIDCAVNDQLAVRIATGAATTYGDRYNFLTIWYHG